MSQLPTYISYYYTITMPPHTQLDTKSGFYTYKLQPPSNSSGMRNSQPQVATTLNWIAIFLKVSERVGGWVGGWLVWVLKCPLQKRFSECSSRTWVPKIAPSEKLFRVQF